MSCTKERKERRQLESKPRSVSSVASGLIKWLFKRSRVSSTPKENFRREREWRFRPALSAQTRGDFPRWSCKFPRLIDVGVSTEVNPSSASHLLFVYPLFNLLNIPVYIYRTKAWRACLSLSLSFPPPRPNVREILKTFSFSPIL